MNPPVCSHEYEGVDGDVGRDVNDVLDCPAPGQTEGPEHQDVVTGRGRDTDLHSTRELKNYFSSTFTIID